MKNVRFIELKDLAQDKIALQGVFEPGAIDFSSDAIRQSGLLDWSAEAERVGHEIRIVGTLKTAVETSCSRCLEPARYEVSRPFDLFFRERDEQMFDEDEEIELSPDDMRTAFFAGTKLAIGDILREQVLLSIPMKVLCTAECKGLCPTCGINLNLNTCTCPNERFSPHMDKLLEIKRKLEERSS